MKALITGASSGLGADYAKLLSDMGYDLILVARRKERLSELKKQLKTNVEIISMDLSSAFNCSKLFNKFKDDKIDILINNAGFGVYGYFDKTNLDKELDLIDINIKAVHILTKLFLEKFLEKDSGYILNISSSAAFQPGPLMASYYASKSYVYNLTCALHEELRRKKSNVSVSVFCPGPFNTEFNKVAGVEFSVKPLESIDVAKYSLDKMFKRKLVIIPDYKMRIAKVISKLIPLKILMKITYNIQKKKEKND